MLSHNLFSLALALHITLTTPAQTTTTSTKPLPILTETSIPLPTGPSCLPQYSSAPGAKPTLTAIQQGFNYDADAKDWVTTFSTASSLQGQEGKFTSARLYSMIETNSTNTLTGAIAAAVSNGKTTLLLGLFADAGQAAFDIELQLLESAITQYGAKFTSQIYGISVGSEDFYRLSIDNAKGKGDTVPNIQHYICQTRQLLASHGLQHDIPVGHTDTWQMWLDARFGQRILGNIDFVGMDDYPYWEYIGESNAAANLTGVYKDVERGVRGLPVWITETGWPVSVPGGGGNKTDAAKPGLREASDYWQSVGCGVCFGRINTWWYTFGDGERSKGMGEPSFGVVGGEKDTCGLFDLRCASGEGGNLTKADGKCTFSTTENSGAVAVAERFGWAVGVMALIVWSLTRCCTPDFGL